ncbi:MAG TPA: type II toxin-antitoxin system VapC family toxin [Rhodopseudomonas sp.]|uniref:type II toxin-antitoxin system VapC family toxin n=1 Tax=Rhodopseudomonas sp. TaxID=1078 RepID=UPI002ED81A69
MTTFVDTNVLIYLLRPEDAFHEWAKTVVQEYQSKEGPLVICDVVFSEFSVGMADLAQARGAIARFNIQRYPFSDEVLFRAGRAFKAHREQGGKRSNVLSDYLIGAQAEIEDAPLLTNNAKEFLSYFPAVKLIRPPVPEQPGQPNSSAKDCR